MKKEICFVVCCILVFAITSCGKITVKGVDGAEYESYQECCAAQDFQAAHQFIAKMENKNMDGYEIRKAKKEVFKKESLFLMSQGDEDSHKRIIYLLKEDEGNMDYLSKLIDLAIDNGDEAFAVQLIGQMGRHNSDIEKYLPVLVRDPGQKGADIIFNHLSYENRFPLTVPEGTLMVDEEISDYHNRAVDAINDFNKLCDEILKLSIEYKNKNIASKIIEMYQKVPCGWEKGKRATYSNSAKKSAQEKMRAADF